MSDSAYLKQFVENHPKNKMAWYLLGKEYEAAGKEGKAHYCFIQAGSVYEAFESSKVPADLWREYQENLLQEQKRKAKRSSLLRKTGVAFLLLLLIWLPSAGAPGQFVRQAALDPDAVSTGPESAGPEEGGQKKPASAQTPVPMAARGYTAKTYFGNDADKVIALGAVLDDGKAAAALETAVLGMQRYGKWSVWSDDMPVVYAVTQSPDTGRATVQSYDAEACACEPPDASELQEGAPEWIARQESLAVLSSAMFQYKLAKGTWPTSLDELTGTFPDNWLAGSDPVMREAFAALKERLEQSEGADGAGASGGQTAGTIASGALLPGGEPFFVQPLEVIVDKKQHRLAVVSGSIIVRSYKVGLGGDNTPEGTFRISDKVINPNGRDDGEFGSRGMQLSDTNYAIHGTNEPDSIGKDESLGCIRMTKEDVEELFDLLPKGSKVTIGKGILPKLDSVPETRFALGDRQDQTNPRRTYHWLN
ncbi:L,D-transpeptidase [Paenibacillus sp. M1]|uniref:L,D-transpeptidase n=1 Tax=Paenibacillus haidiansis TaxID=1574488 RepID=A0ABU7VP34_9BACL